MRIPLVVMVLAGAFLVPCALIPNAPAQASPKPTADVLDDICALLRARDSSLEFLSWSFSVYTCDVAGSAAVDSLWKQGRLVQAGEKRRLDLSDLDEKTSRLVIWDGGTLLDCTRHLDDPDRRQVIEKRSEPAGAFEGAQFPQSLGLSFLGYPMADVLATHYEARLRGRESADGVECLRIDVLSKVNTTGTDEERTVGKLWLDDKNTLLVRKSETYYPATPLPAARNTTPAARPATASANGVVRWSMNSCTQTNGTWLPTSGLVEYIGISVVTKPCVRVVVDESSIALERPQAEVFTMPVEEGAHMRDAATGRMTLQHTNNHDGVSLARLNSTVERMSGTTIDHSEPWPGVNGAFFDIPCGIGAAYMYLRAHGADVSVGDLSAEIPVVAGQAVAMIDLVSLLNRHAQGVSAYEVDVRHDSLPPIACIALVEAAEHPTGHYVLIAGDGGDIRTGDPYEGVKSISREEFATKVGSTIWIIAPRQAWHYLSWRSLGVCAAGVFVALLVWRVTRKRRRQ